MAIPKDEWVPRFARKLRQIQPAIAGDDAMGLALGESQFIEASALTPEEAAETYALEEPPVDGGAPEDS